MNFATSIQAGHDSLPGSSRPGGILQRKCACGNHTGSTGECGFCKKKRLNLQRKQQEQRDQAAAIPKIVHTVLRASGAPLETATREFMESHLGHDFSQVRVHTGAEAARSATAVNAQAYTVGNNIVFGSARYKPGSPAGIGLLAHELTHVSQQRRGEVSASNEYAAADSALEKEADRFADSASRAFGKHASGRDMPSAAERTRAHLGENDDEPISIEPDDARYLYVANGTTTCTFPAGTATTSINNTACTRPCTSRHEGVHRTDISACCASAGRAHAAATTAAARQTVEDRFFTWMGSNRSWFECRAYAESVSCADEMLAAKSCASSPAAADAACCSTLSAYRADKETRRASNCAAAASNLSACPFT